MGRHGGVSRRDSEPGSPKKTEALRFFLGLDPTVLYRIAALPDGIAATLTPDTLLADTPAQGYVPNSRQF